MDVHGFSARTLGSLRSPRNPRLRMESKGRTHQALPSQIFCFNLKQGLPPSVEDVPILFSTVEHNFDFLGRFVPLMFWE